MAAVARRQTCCNGALGARGVYSLQSFGREEASEIIFDENAYTITSTYHDGTLKLYTTHLTRPRNPNSGDLEYHMTLLDSFAITGTVTKFREGVGAFRNAREWAKEQRDRLIVAANAKVMGTLVTTQVDDAGLGSTSASLSHSQLSRSSYEDGLLRGSETSVEEEVSR